MKLKELQTLLDNQPSVSGNTFLVVSLYAISWALAIAFFVLAIGLLLEGSFDFKIFLDWVSRQLNLVLNTGQRTSIATSFGFLSLVLSAIFVGVIFLCRMILQRNHFILQVEDWIYENLSEVKQKRTTKTRKK